MAKANWWIRIESIYCIGMVGSTHCCHGERQKRMHGTDGTCWNWWHIILRLSSQWHMCGFLDSYPQHGILTLLSMITLPRKGTAMTSQLLTDPFICMPSESMLGKQRSKNEHWAYWAPMDMLQSGQVVLSIPGCRFVPGVCDYTIELNIANSKSQNKC